MTKPYDIIIVGAGINGALLARMLSNQAHFRVALIDAKNPMPDLTAHSFSPRVSALTRSTMDYLKTCDIWRVIEADRVGWFTAMHVEDTFGGDITLLAEEAGCEYLGAIVENDRLLHPILTDIQADCFFETALKAMHVQEASVQVEMADGQCIGGALVVGADGARSWVRDTLECELTTWPYDHDAIIAHVHMEKPHRQTASQVFLPTGPVACLPLGGDGHHASLVWSASPDMADELMAMTPEVFCSAYSDVFSDRFGMLKLISERQRFPLIMRHAKQYVHGRVVLLGDAAHTVHPLAGLGLNLGIQDVMTLASCLKDSPKKRWLSALRRYERIRRTENWQMILGLEGIKRLFAGEHRMIQSARRWGMQGIDRFSLLKQWVIDRANLSK